MPVNVTSAWPVDLPAAASPEFDTRVVAWLLDRAPADLRTSPLRRHPLALALVVDHVLQGQVRGLREAYSSVRVELGADLGPEEVAGVLTSIEAAGALLLQAGREVQEVRKALVGRYSRPHHPSP